MSRWGSPGWTPIYNSILSQPLPTPLPLNVTDSVRFIQIRMGLIFELNSKLSKKKKKKWFPLNWGSRINGLGWSILVRLYPMSFGPFSGWISNLKKKDLWVFRKPPNNYSVFFLSSSLHPLTSVLPSFFVFNRFKRPSDLTILIKQAPYYHLLHYFHWVLSFLFLFDSFEFF